MKKIRLLMFFFAIFIAFVCLGTTTVQADIQNIATTDEMLRIVFQNYLQPVDSPNAVLVDGVITLQNDYNTDNCGYIISGNYKIDLNGHTINYNQSSGNPFFSIGSGSSIEIGDKTNTTGGISITGNLRALYLFSVDGGSLIINNGTYINTASNMYCGVGNIKINSGTAIINGGIFKTSFDYNVYIQGGDLTINDGSFLDAEKSIVAQGSNNSINSLTINNGTFATRKDSIINLAIQFNQLNGIRINGGKFTGNTYGILYYDENQNTTVTAEQVKSIIGANSKVVGGLEFTKIYDTSNRLKGYITGQTLEIKEKKKYDVVLTATVTGGTIAVDDLKPFEDSLVTIRVQPISGYKLKDIKILKYTDDSDVTSSLSYNKINNTFTMPGYSIKIIPEFELIPLETFNVTFDTNGGSAVANQTITNGETAILPTAPTKDNYTFKGWYKDINLTIPFDFKTSIIASTTIYAKWEEKFSEETITENEDNMTISVKGIFNGKPVIVITKTEKGNEGYNSLISLIKENEKVIGSYDISITGGTYKGELELIFTVGKQYEGEQITVYHKKASGEVETKTTTIKEGKAIINVDELSPFMLVADKEILEMKDKTPKTGDNTYSYAGTVIIVIIGIFGINKLKKEN